MIGRMFKVPGHKNFEYKPRYYDPVKEEIEERMRKHNDTQLNDRKAVKERISRGFSNYQSRNNSYSKGVLRSNITVLLIAVILVLLGWGLLKYMPADLFNF